MIGVVGVVPPEVWGVCCVARVVGVGAAWLIIWVVGVAVVTAIVWVAAANPLTPIVVITIVVTLRHHRM